MPGRAARGAGERSRRRSAAVRCPGVACRPGPAGVPVRTGGAGAGPSLAPAPPVSGRRVAACGASASASRAPPLPGPRPVACVTPRSAGSVSASRAHGVTCASRRTRKICSVFFRVYLSKHAFTRVCGVSRFSSASLVSSPFLGFFSSVCGGDGCAAPGRAFKPLQAVTQCGSRFFLIRMTVNRVLARRMCHPGEWGWQERVASAVRSVSEAGWRWTPLS